jgi:long-chain acyl-CoA synthetase
LCRISSEEWIAHPNSVGRAVAPFEVVVLDPEGQAVPAGQPGRLGFRAPTSRRISYHDDPEKTAAAYLAPDVFTLGDIGYVTADGYVHVTDRESDMVISGGVNLYPSEAEGVLREHPAVADVAVIGIPESDLGEQLLALVVPQDPTAPPAPEELEKWGRAHLAGYKVPRRYDFVVELPRNEMQKIDKRALRRPYWAGERNIAG